MLDAILDRLGWLDSPKGRQGRVVLGLFLFLFSLVNWPLSMFTYASTEPPVVLSLSWFAIIIEALTLITASQVFEEGGGK
jgi:hypothetical protein